VEVSGIFAGDGLDCGDDFSDVNVFDEPSLKVIDGDFPFGVIDVNECVFDGVFVCV